MAFISSTIIGVFWSSRSHRRDTSGIYYVISSLNVVKLFLLLWSLALLSLIHLHLYPLDLFILLPTHLAFMSIAPFGVIITHFPQLKVEHWLPRVDFSQDLILRVLPYWYFQSTL